MILILCHGVENSVKSTVKFSLVELLSNPESDEFSLVELLSNPVSDEFSNSYVTNHVVVGRGIISPLDTQLNTAVMLVMSLSSRQKSLPMS